MGGLFSYPFVSRRLVWVCSENAFYPIPTLTLLEGEGIKYLLFLRERIKSLPLNGSIRGEGGLIFIPLCELTARVGLSRK